MVEITNISTNPLPLSDGKFLAPGDSRKVKEVGESERNYEERGWLTIIDEKKEEPTKEPAKTEVKK